MLDTNRLDTMNMTEKSKQLEYDWPIDATLDMIGGKWKPLIIYALNTETLRFSQLLAKVHPRVTQRMLTKQLRQLEEDGLVNRKVYTQVPPKVEYSLTELGKSLMPILDQLCDWGSEHMHNRIKYKCEP